MRPRRGVFVLPVLLLAAACAGRAASPPATRLEPAGIHHPLQRGQTLYALSQAYNVPVPTLMAVNGIEDPTNIPAGTPIFVPGAARLLTVPASGGASLMWPMAGPVTSMYRSRGGTHSGIDIDGEMGAPILAAAGGQVVSAGKDGTYGLTVVVDHGDGLTTLYAHCRALLVKTGDSVNGGQTIAEVGRSGNARGAHLHFEVRRHGRAVDPGPLLSPRGSAMAARK